MAVRGFSDVNRSVNGESWWKCFPRNCLIKGPWKAE
jgi:hypothetical protein